MLSSISGIIICSKGAGAFLGGRDDLIAYYWILWYNYSVVIGVECHVKGRKRLFIQRES